LGAMVEDIDYSPKSSFVWKIKFCGDVLFKGYHINKHNLLPRKGVLHLI
jgi:hypothetical protein